MTYERWQYYERQDALREGAARQKAEDDKLIAQKDAEVARQAEKIASLKAQLAAVLGR